MEKDPKKVAIRAARLKDENWRFRTFVKFLGRPSPARVDSLARKFGRAAEAEMDCTKCGACCREICVPLSPEEQARLVKRVGISPEEFVKRFVTIDDDGDPGIDARPCPFLAGNVCLVYEDRPDACRGYPYVGGNIASRMIGIIERAGTCPIIFEMLEQLKVALKFKPRD